MPHPRADRTCRLLLVVPAMMLIAVGLSACGATGPAYGPATPGVAATVTMTPEFMFQPSNVSIRTGDTVEWRNKSLISHTVTADPAKAENHGDASLPPGAEPFQSDRIPAGGIYRHTFTTPGVYRYFCTPHEDEGMLGEITVRPR